MFYLEDEGASHDVGDDEAECQPDGDVSLGVVLGQILMKWSVFYEVQLKLKTQLWKHLDLQDRVTILLV